MRFRPGRLDTISLDRVKKHLRMRRMSDARGLYCNVWASSELGQTSTWFSLFAGRSADKLQQKIKRIASVKRTAKGRNTV
jgi:hypothetical protein